MAVNTGEGVLSLGAGIKKIAAEYLTAKTQPLRDHPLAAFIRETFVKDIDDAINPPDRLPRLVVQATKLPGNWAAVPWVGMMDVRLTSAIQQGIYVVLLFAEDMQSAALALGMGVTDTPKTTLSAWQSDVQTDFPPPPGFTMGPMPPGTLASQGLGARYERATICFKEYPISGLPEEPVLVADFRAVCNLLRKIGDSGKYQSANVASSAATESFTIRGQEFRFSAAEVVGAFEQTTDAQWQGLSAIEPYWQITVMGQNKPVKAVFRNLPKIPEDFGFTTHDATRVFKRLGFTVINTKATEETKELLVTPPSHPLNRILYGPPGTGKTWTTARLAVEICNGSAPSDRAELMQAYTELIKTSHIAFTTFHQSIGYEEFVEGLRPVTGNDDEGGSQLSAGFRLEPRSGIFRNISALAEQARKRGGRVGKFDFTGRQFFKMSLGRARTDGHIYDDAIEGNYIVLGWGGEVDWSDPKYEDYQTVFDHWQKEEPGATGNSGNISQVWRFRSTMKKGDIVIVSDGNFRFRAIGEVTGDYQFLPQNQGGNHRRSVKWLAVLDESLPIETIYEANFSQASCYLLTRSRLKLDSLAELIASELTPSSTPARFVLIIDEINRANVSKVLGELITLLEPDKRLGEQNALTVKLPYSNGDFGVPNNLYVIGTMNTADRSIAMLDTALRRRFHFTEMMPDYTAVRLN